MIEFNETETAIYYRTRVPSLRQRGRNWRGRSPLRRDARRDSFSVEAVTGRCYDHASGFKGDILGLEMALTGTSFPEACRYVFAIIGRPDPASNPAERRRMAQQAAADRRDQPLADLLHAGWLVDVAARLFEEKARLFDPVAEPIGDEGEFIGTLTRIEKQLRKTNAAERLAYYRYAFKADPTGTRRLIARAAEDQRNATKWATIVVRTLEIAERRRDRRVA